MDDDKLLKFYYEGFSDEIYGTVRDLTKGGDSLINKAYTLGRDHAILGDDVRSVDYMSESDILLLIKTK